jgi:hypothetical protein
MAAQATSLSRLLTGLVGRHPRVEKPTAPSAIPSGKRGMVRAVHNGRMRGPAALRAWAARAQLLPHGVALGADPPTGFTDKAPFGGRVTHRWDSPRGIAGSSTLYAPGRRPGRHGGLRMRPGVLLDHIRGIGEYRWSTRCKFGAIACSKGLPGTPRASGLNTTESMSCAVL